MVSAKRSDYRRKEIPNIVSVTPLSDYRVHLVLGSGSTLELNFANRLDTIRYCPLADPEVFASVSTNGWSLSFGRALELSIQEIVELAVIAPPEYLYGGSYDE